MVHVRKIHARTPRRHSGFTLIETAMTVVIVGLAIVAMVQLLAAGTVANIDSAELTSGVTLARDVREFALKLAFTDPKSPTIFGLDPSEKANDPTTYNDVNDMAGRTFSPPIDSSGKPIAGFDDWSQEVKVETVDPNCVTSNRPNGTEPANRITVNVYHKTTKVCDLTWYVFAATP